VLPTTPPRGMAPGRRVCDWRVAVRRLSGRHVYKTLDDLPWTDEAWLANANEWIDGELARVGLTPAGLREQPHIRPWSTVLRVPTNDGDLYFKAVWPPQVHEAALTAALSSWLPRFTPELIAVRPATGWLLLRDAGLRLREILKQEQDISRWREVLARYAVAQIKLADRAKSILDLGVPDRRPAVVADHLTDLLEDSRALRVGLPDGLSVDEHSRMRELLPRIQSQLAALADSDVPATLEHNDFHDGNVCLLKNDYRVFDWGDACVTHPFVVLRVGLRSIAHTFDLAADGPEITELRDAYLEPWSAFAPRPQLLAEVQPALILAAACRAFSWRLVVNELDPPLLDEWADTVAYSVRSLLELAETTT